MANYFVSLCLLRVALPVCLTLSVIFRPSMLSAMYLLLLLYLPAVPIPSTRSMAGHTGVYLKIVICISFLTSISQLTFQIVLLSIPPYAHFLKDCEFLERILRHVGFIRLDGLSAESVAQWLSPEIVMLFASIVIYILCSKINAKQVEDSPEGASEEGLVEDDGEPKKKKKKYGFVVTVGRYLSLVSLAVAACLRPSVPGAFYFLIFLGGATWWACYKELRKAFAYILRIVLVVLFFHICTLYGYQFQWPQEYLSPNSTYARYFGLTPIMSVDCEDPRSIIFNDLEWASYLNPVWLLWLYYIIALESKLLLMPQVFSGAFRASVASERTPLIRGVSPSRKYTSGSGRSILQDSTGSVTITAEGHDEIPMQQLGTAEEELQASLFDNIVLGLASVAQVLVRSSYIATNITMMAWSITYHSWLTFVLLLWANLLWLLPNQRRAMLRSAPFLVIYAEFLLLSAYVYGMNLTEDELPSKIQNINLAQIGFEKILILPCKPLLVKCLYTMMFWITLRQFMQERQEARQTSALADMVAPLQVTVGTATSGVSKDEETQGSRVMKRLGELLNKFLTKFWIWIVAINLFLVAITGDRMTGFRIIYMFLFLFFILTFQLSFGVWRKIMYGFWITVIAYSMLTLVLVYTYQFDNFPSYWTTYLHIPPEQQLDIGLETYETKQLFVRLLTPTFFVVITVVQVHYFHKDFLEISNIRARRASSAREGDPRSEASSAQGGPWDPESEKSETETTDRPRVSVSSLRNKESLISILKYAWHKIQIFLDYVWLYLEIHIFKIVLLIALLLTVFDTCAIHLLIMVLAVLAVTLGRKVQTCTVHVCSVIISVMLLLRMIYQIKYIHHSTYDVICNDNVTITITNTTEYNNAEWFGFYKVDRGRALPSIMKWYIGFITVVTIRAIINIRQQIWRINEGKPLQRPFFLFPKITRADADKNVMKCLMYLMNYGFYKFGVEVSLMATVGLIGTRMDFYACLYGFWLAPMCMMERKQLSKIWNWYLAFIAFVLPVQYFMVVGLPPGLCQLFPWDIEGGDPRLRRMQDWMFLLDIKYPPSAQKLICDIFVLILVARQSVVFRIEKRYEGTNPEYPGGSNESIIHKMEESDFVNPVPDFVTYVRSWLDIFKRIILLSFMWVTLAIVFLAGTNRVNLFSLGYLIGSFMFLWQGSDLFLRSVPKILQSWNWLLGYNVFVILVKTILQIWGCIFIDDVSACWLLRLLGIGCIKKFGTSPLVSNITSESQCSPVPREDIGLAWDGLCFGFLIMQRRIFQSYNFIHIIDETKATTILASRGAELMEELREKQMAQKEEQEGKILEKIKHKMDRIKATQQKIQGPNYKETTNHFVDSIYPGSRPLRPRKVATTYKDAIRSGDYYMFDDVDDDELELITERDDDDEELEEDLDIQKMTLGQQDKESPKGSQKGTVTIKEEKPEEKDEPKPGSSKQYADDELSLLSEKTGEESKVRNIINILLFIWHFIESILNTITSYLNRFSRDYRYVLKVLSKEKKMLKEKTDFRSGLRSISTQIWEPAVSFQTLVRHSRSQLDAEEIVEPQQPSSLEPIIPKQKRKYLSYTADGQSQTPVDIIADYETAEMSSYDQPSVVRLLHAIWFAILSHSDLVCYFMIFLNQIKSASLLSIPLPLMVFLWGTLTIPRPSKSFWITVIAYTEVIVIIKCVFQFKILDEVAATQNPFYPPRIIGIERTSHYATYDLLLLLVLFFHRLMLKTLGLWKTTVDTVSTLEDGIYKLDDDDNQSLSSRLKPERKKRHYPQPQYSPYLPDSFTTISLLSFENQTPSQIKMSNLEKFTTLAKIVGRFFTAEYRTCFSDRSPKIKFASSGKKHPLNRLRFRTGYQPLAKEKKIGHRGVLKKIRKSSRRSIKDLKFKPQVLPKLTPGILKATNRLSFQSDSIKEELPHDSPEHEEEIIHSEIDESCVKLTSKEIPALSKMPGAIKKAMEKYFESAKQFCTALLDPTSRITVDVYAYMFMCDFFNFMVVIFGFAAFGTQQGDGGVSAYLQENRVPIPFLLMLILQFILIIVDRALFLRKYILGKIIFQFMQIVGVHIWMFFVLPGVTERSFNALLPPQMWYMVKCFYFLLSAYQIRCGYPRRILGNFLCKGYNYVNMFLFKAFMAIPFLFELRTIMDWMWTDTSMTVFDWLKMEDIFAHIFQLKCSRHVESEYPQPRGEKKKNIVKYFMGGAGLFAIIAVIWFPLVFFALGNTVGEANIPYDVTVNVRIGPYQPIYSMSAQTNAIYSFTEREYEIMNNIYKRNRVALTFLSSYTHDDIAAVILNGNSTMVWAISPPDIDRMLLEIESDNEIALRLQYVISRLSNSKDSGIISSEIEVKMPAKMNGQPNPQRLKLAEMLKGNKTIEPVLVSGLFPKFVKVTNRNIAPPIIQLLDAGESVADNSLRNLTMRLSRSDPTPAQSSLMWWEIREECNDKNYAKYIRKIPRQNCEYLVMYTFNEKSFPASLSFLSGGGIIGLYTTLVFVASRMIRGFFSEICFKIMFDDMPNVDRILQLCLDIYLVREARELCLEEDLFAKLVFLFRSPETLIKWTRPKEEEDQEGEGEEDEEEDESRQAH